MRTYPGGNEEGWDPDLLTQSTFTSPKRSCSEPSLSLSEVPSEIIIRSRIKYGNRWAGFKGIMAEYSKSTSIHGMRYIFEVHRPLYEKVFWIVLIVMSLYVAFTLMWSSYLKWCNSPVILGFDETYTPVNKIPFPTITICPEMQVASERFDFLNISKQIWSEIENNQTFQNWTNTLTDGQLNKFMSILQICESEVLQRFSPYMPKDTDADVIQTLAGLALVSNRQWLTCKWNDRIYSCEHIMRYVLTDEGICYQFNGLQSNDIYRDPNYQSYNNKTKIDFNNYIDTELPRYKDITGNWSLDKGYVDQGFNAYPQRSVLSSVRHGLSTVMVESQLNLDNACRSSKRGYKIFLNSPESVPITTNNYILVPHDVEVLVSLIPQYITSTDNLHDINPEKRQCYFNDERYLRFFKSYSQGNCETECLVNFTIAECGCVKFWMPKPANIPACTLADVKCYTKAAEEINVLVASQTEEKFRNPEAKIICDCMPSCNSLDYDFEISRAFYDFDKTLRAFRDGDSYSNEKTRMTRVSIYFKESQFTAIKRTVIYGVTTLIAHCGGILGLFMGMSLLSVVEFIYFFSIRLFRNLRRRQMIKNVLLSQQAETIWN